MYIYFYKFPKKVGGAAILGCGLKPILSLMTSAREGWVSPSDTPPPEGQDTSSRWRFLFWETEAGLQVVHGIVFSTVKNVAYKS